MTDFIKDAIEAAAVTFSYESQGENAYRCTMTSTHGMMIRTITMKPGYDAPALGSIIYHYALVAQTLDEYDDILEWAKDEGHDPGDTQVRAKFEQMVEDQKELRLLLSETVYQDMMTGLAISQAINNAMPRG